MKLQIPRPIIMKVLPILVVTVALASIPALPTMSQNYSYGCNGYQHCATSVANSAGTLQVLWGDPYQPATISQGSGNETLTVQGYVASRPDLPGYYTYTYPTTTGELEAQWRTATETYVVDVYFYQGYSPYNKTTIFPSENTFAAMYIYFNGQLTVNGVTTPVRGLAALVAAAPGFFSFHGAAPATYVILYPQTYHGNQYIFRWSQARQIINGIEQPASGQPMSQTVQLT